jgi:hypothetical protein
MTDSDRNRVIYATIVARAWEDDSFRERLFADPTLVCLEEGMDVPADIRLEMRQDTPQATHVVLPAQQGAEAVTQLAELLKASLPLPPGHALILLQNQPNLDYLVLPVNPRDVKVDLSDEALEEVAAGGYTAVTSNVVANHQVAANAVTVANTVAVTTVAAVALGVCVLVLYPFSCPLVEPSPSRVPLPTP